MNSSHTTTNALSASTVVAVIGSGAMGAGIAQIAAAAGHTVKLFDNRPGAAEVAIGNIRAQFAKLAEKGKLSKDAAQSAGQRLVAVTRETELSDAGLVIEAIVENLQAKQTLYAKLEDVVSPDCIFGTNTSSISVTAIGSALKHPERLVGMHFFNPAPLMALVEIVSGLATDRRIADVLFATALAWGKTPVHARSTPGFIVNRIARPYYAEALRLVHEGVADCATLDAVMREAGGFRMGPFELMDMIGLDINFAVTQSVWNAFFNDPRFTPSLIQQEYVAAGWLGRKNGRGFYDYAPGATKPEPLTEAVHNIPADIVVLGTSAPAEALAGRLASRNVPFRRENRAADGVIATTEGAILSLCDGRSATRRASNTGIAKTVVVDLALDYSLATRLAVSAAIQCAPRAREAAIGLLQAAGYKVSWLKDAPGLPVMRTLAMLANEAADAVNQDVTDEAGVKTAMCLGVGYPRGPLEWARSVGLPHIHRVLANLAESYGEDRYRISPYLQQQLFATTSVRTS